MTRQEQLSEFRENLNRDEDEPLVLDKRIDENTVIFKTKDGKEVEFIRKEQVPKYWIDQYGHVTPINQPIRKGQWLHKEITDNYRVTGQCSECKERRIIDNFCPNCGAEMVEPQESEDKE